MTNAKPVEYIVAVSGGVDSVVLLDVLMKSVGPNGKAALLVAHFDHGIREDSAGDRQFVADLAKRYGLKFEYDEGNLGAGTSEAVAREARYAFLRRVKQAHGARRLVTAHHQDDAIETAMINIMRGTGRRGMSSLQSTDEIFRPLLATPKTNLIQYARDHGLQWREDSTNTDTEYLRNFIRHDMLGRTDRAVKHIFLKLVGEARERNQVIDQLLADLPQLQTPAGETPQLDRQWFVMLPHSVAREVLATWLRRHGVQNFDSKALERLVIAAKSLAPGKTADITKGWSLKVAAKTLALSCADR